MSTTEELIQEILRLTEEDDYPAEDSPGYQNHDHARWADDGGAL